MNANNFVNIRKVRGGRFASFRAECRKCRKDNLCFFQNLKRSNNIIYTPAINMLLRCMTLFRLTGIRVQDGRLRK